MPHVRQFARSRQHDSWWMLASDGQRARRGRVSSRHAMPGFFTNWVTVRVLMAVAAPDPIRRRRQRPLVLLALAEPSPGMAASG